MSCQGMMIPPIVSVHDSLSIALDAGQCLAVVGQFVQRVGEMLSAEAHGTRIHDRMDIRHQPRYELATDNFAGAFGVFRNHYPGDLFGCA